MNGRELFEGMSFVHGKYVEEAREAPAAQERKVIRFWKKPVVFAAIVGLMILLMGSTVVISTILAESDLFDYPLADATTIKPEDIHLTTNSVTAGSMRIECDIDGVEYQKNSVYVLSGGPFTLERKTESGWEPLEARIDDPKWDADEVLCPGTYDWYVDWTALYGMLAPGTYRYTAEIVEDVDAVSVEFTVEEVQNTNLAEVIDSILNSDAYYIRFTETTEFGSMDALNADQIALIQEEYMDEPFVYEYWKHGEDLLQMIYKGEQPWIGMMYKDGEKYSLDHEGDDRTKPVIGWSLWPDMDMNRLTEWASLIPYDNEEVEVIYSADGRLEKLVHRWHQEQFMDYYNVEATNIHTWEFVSCDPSVTAGKFTEQGVDAAQEFSWKDDQKNMKSLDVAYVNTTAHPVTTASEAIARAMAECTVEHDKILCYRDEQAGMWKVEFQIMYGYQGYQFIYLDDNGITQMVSGLGSKEPAWKDLYPDP